MLQNGRRYIFTRAQWRNGKRGRQFRLSIPEELSTGYSLAGGAVHESGLPFLIFEERQEWTTLTTREAAGLTKYFQESTSQPYPAFTLESRYDDFEEMVEMEPFFIPKEADRVLPGTSAGDRLIDADYALKRLAYQIDFPDGQFQKALPRVFSQGFVPGFDRQSQWQPQNNIARSTTIHRRIWVEVDSVEAKIIKTKDFEVFLFPQDPKMRIKQRRRIFLPSRRLLDDFQEPDSYETWVTEQWTENYQFLGKYYESSLLKLPEFRKFIDILMFLDDKGVTLCDVNRKETRSLAGDKYNSIPVIKVDTGNGVFSGGVGLGEAATLKISCDDQSSLSLHDMFAWWRKPCGEPVVSLRRLAGLQSNGHVSDSDTSLGHFLYSKHSEMVPGGSDLGTAKTEKVEVNGWLDCGQCLDIVLSSDRIQEVGLFLQTACNAAPVAKIGEITWRASGRLPPNGITPGRRGVQKIWVGGLCVYASVSLEFVAMLKLRRIQRAIPWFATLSTITNNNERDLEIRANSRGNETEQ
jgi:hypothetical protein